MLATKTHRRRVTMDAYSAVKNPNSQKRDLSAQKANQPSHEAPEPTIEKPANEEMLRRSSTISIIQKRPKNMPWTQKAEDISHNEYLTAEKVLQNSGFRLSEYEKREIWSYPRIYFLGTDLGKELGDFTDEESFYKGFISSSIAYRYEIVGFLGKGAFAQVFDCLDHKSGKNFAIKILRNNEPYRASGLEECRILDLIKAGKCPDKGISYIYDHFEYRGHSCIVLEKLNENLSDFQKKRHKNCLPLDLVANITKQILRSVSFIHNLNLIHCDLKPDNIMFRNSEQVEIIDFNSACEVSRKVSDYVQSRPYRAPEIVIDLEYSNKIDMWSIGCIVLEMITGKQIFPCETENELFKMYIEICGFPKRDYIMKGRRGNMFVDRLGKFKIKATAKINSVDKILQGYDPKIIDFVDRLLKWDPVERLSAHQALNHEWMNTIL